MDSCEITPLVGLYALPAPDLEGALLSSQAARELVEQVRWPGGPICTECGSARTHRIEGEVSAARNLIECNDCEKQFSWKSETPFTGSLNDPHHVVATVLGVRKHADSALAAAATQKRLGIGARRAKTLVVAVERWRPANRPEGAGVTPSPDAPVRPRRPRRRHVAAVAAATLGLSAGLLWNRPKPLNVRQELAGETDEWSYPHMHQGEIMWITVGRDSGESRADWTARFEAEIAAYQAEFPED